MNFGVTYNCVVKPFADPPATMTGEIARLRILVDVLGEIDPRLAGQVALTNIRGGCVYDSGGRASSALFIKRWRERDTFRAGSVLRDDFGR